MYPVVFFDALRVNIRDQGTVRSKAVYFALALLPGSRDGSELLAQRPQSIRHRVRGTLHGADEHRMNARMDAAVTVDAQNASTATWKPAQHAVSHSARTHHGRAHEIPDALHGPHQIKSISLISLISL